MNTLQDYINQVRELVHDTNSADFSDATLTNFINQARVRVSLDTHCVRGLFAEITGNALNTIGEQENYYYSGTVGGITVNSPGSGYTNPVVTLTGGGGSGAAAQAQVINGQIAEINMTNWGANYGTAPTVQITDPTGTGFAASATVLANILDILSITVIWGNERWMFSYCGFTMFQAICRQFTKQYDVPGIFTIHQGTKQFLLCQIPDQAYGLEMDFITIASPLVNLTDIDTQIVAPQDDAVQLFSSHLCLASLQNYEMADYWYSGNEKKPGKYDLRIKQLYATGQSRRIYNPYYTFAKRARRL